MCFTISYGLVRFPDAGILDAAPNTALSSTDNMTTTKCKSMKMPTDGTDLLQDESTSQTALPETEATSDDLFVTQQTTPPVKEVAESKVDNDASAKEANKAQENKKKKSNKGGSKTKEEKKPIEPKSEESELPKLESETVNSVDENVDPLTLIGVPDEDQLSPDNSKPIESEDPLPKLDKTDQDIPSIFVDHNPPEFELGPISEPEEPEQEEPSIPELSPETEKAVDDYWDTVFDESSQSNKDNFQSDSGASSEPETKTPATAAPSEIKTDPNAQEIPPRNREQKPANQDALTLPALDEPQSGIPNASQPDTGTIPMESFPLDASAMQNVNYTVDYQQEPYDSFGFNIPETGQIIVKRLPPIENSVDPIYNNAQLDKFAL